MSSHDLRVSQCDNYNLKHHKYQPHAKSNPKLKPKLNPYPNPTTK